MNIFKRLVFDTPFIIHTVRDFEYGQNRVVGQNAKDYLEIFWHDIFNSMPCITIAGGSPGSGKSFTLSNIEQKILMNKNLGWPVMIRLTDSSFKDDNEISKIIEKETGHSIEDIGEILEEENKKIFLLIDNVDEYIRYKEKNQNIEPKNMLLKIMREICKLEHKLSGRFCSVLSLTDNIIYTLNLASNEQDNIINSLSKGDRNIKDRYRPIINKDGSGLLLFKEISLDDTAEMIYNSMNTWKERNKDLWNEYSGILKTEKKCIYITDDDKKYDIFPFTEDALKLIHNVALGNPGEIVLASMSSIHQLYGIKSQLEIKGMDIFENPFIDEAIASLGILQIERMKKKAEEIKINLIEKIKKNEDILHFYYIPEIARNIAKNEVDLREQLGQDFFYFLELMGINIDSHYSDVIFGRTRGYFSEKIKFNEKIVEGFPPLYDAGFVFNSDKNGKKKVGVVFLIPPKDSYSNIYRLLTGARIIRDLSGGSNHGINESEKDSLLIVCNDADVEKYTIELINNSINNDDNELFISMQKDYRNCIQVIRVDELWPWILKLLNPNNYDELEIEEASTQAFLMEKIKVTYWKMDVANNCISQNTEMMSWLEALTIIENYPNDRIRTVGKKHNLNMSTG